MLTAMLWCSTTKRVYRIDKIDDHKSHVFFKTAPNTAQDVANAEWTFVYFVLVWFTICYRFVTFKDMFSSYSIRSLGFYVVGAAGGGHFYVSFFVDGG